VTAAKAIVSIRNLLLLAVSFSVIYWSASASTKKQFATPAGLLVIEQLNDQPLGTEFEVRLANQVVLHTKQGDDATAFPDFPVPDIIKYVGEPIGPFDAVAVFQQFTWGNLCNGSGYIWFLGIARDGRYNKSAPVDACGVLAPQVSVNDGTIHLTLTQPSQASPGQEWTYSGRELKQIR
jgi:hypothetical protein